MFAKIEGTHNLQVPKSLIIVPKSNPVNNLIQS
jgi:hypothetical protein